MFIISPGFCGFVDGSTFAVFGVAPGDRGSFGFVDGLTTLPKASFSQAPKEESHPESAKPARSGKNILISGR